MKKTITLLILITIIAFYLSGCYDSNSLESFYYVIALAIDEGINNKLNLSIQIAVSEKNTDSSSQSTKGNIYSVECDSITSGLSILDNYLSKKLDLTHCSAIVFSEEFAKQGISLEINTLANNNEIRPNCNILISNKTALEILEKVSNSGENFSSRYYEFIINSSEYTGYSTISSLGEFFYNLNNNITQPIANYITVTDNLIQSNGISVFKNDILVGNLTAPEAMAHSILTNQFDTAIVSIQDPFEPTKLMDISISLEKSNMDVSILNNTPYIKIKTEILGKVKSATNDFDYSSLESISIIEYSLNKYISSLISTYLYKISRDYNSDICYLGENLSKKYLTLENFKKIHWEEVFKDAIFDIHIDSRINSSYLFNQE